MSLVFISYSHTDSDTADSIVAALSEVGIACFRDVKDIKWGDAITQSVRDGLDSAAALIVIVSPGSLKSHWVSYEIGYATATKKRVLPYLTHPALEPPAFITDLMHVNSTDQVKHFFTANPDWSTHSPKRPNSNDGFEAAFTKVAEKMPNLLREMKEDLSGDNPFIREFVPLKAGVIFNHGDEDRFEYRDDVHPNLFNKITMLETNDLVSVCHVGKYTKIYRFSESFVERLLAWEPPA